MAINFADRVRVTTATSGTGTINLGSATAGYRTFAQAVSDGALTSGSTVYYGIQDGVAWECGTGVYTAGSPDTLTRVVNSSSAGGTTAISLDGSAQVAIMLTQLSVVTALLTSGSINGTTVGATSASTGAFTSLSASSTVSGSGFSTYLASPPAIGGSSAGTGAFTTLTASSTVSGSGFTPYALLASPTFTGTPAAPTASAGTNTTQIATTAFVSTMTDGLFSQSVAGSSNVNLTGANAANAILVFTGALTGNITVSVPSGSSGEWIVFNNTSGAFTLTFITASGTGVLLSQGFKNMAYTDGTNMFYSVNSGAVVSVQWTGGTIVTNGTYYFTIYAPYAGTILSMDYFTQTSTSFVANVQIAGSSVTSLSAVTVNSATQANTAASGANVFAVGQVISVVITSATSSPTAAVLSLRLTKS